MTAQSPLATRAEPPFVPDEPRPRFGVVLQLPLEPGERPARERSAVRHVVCRTVPDVHVRIDRDDVAPLERLPVELGILICDIGFAADEVCDRRMHLVENRALELVA